MRNPDTSIQLDELKRAEQKLAEQVSSKRTGRGNEEPGTLTPPRPGERTTTQEE
jgi:hypothetical protein